ncbi:hypothetical protein [Methylomonas sp. MgM2]
MADNKLILTIYDDACIGANLAIDDQPVQEFFSVDERLTVLETAAKKLDNDVLEIARAFKNCAEGIYAWPITDNWYLHDSFRLKGKNNIIWYYYLIELINEIHRIKQVDCICIESSFVSGALDEVLRANSFLVKRKLKGSFFWHLKNAAYFIKNVSVLIFMMNGFLNRKPRLKRKGYPCVAIDVSGGSNHKYGGFLRQITSDYVSISINLKKGIFFENGIAYRLLSLLDLKAWVIGVHELISFNKALKQKQSQINHHNLLFKFIKKSNYILFFKNVLLILSIRKVFEVFQVKFVFFQSSLNNNLKKIFVFVAREKMAPSVCFLPRSLAELRPAERVFKDRDFPLEQQLLPDFYHVTDKNSYELLVQHGIDAHRIIESDRAGRDDAPLRFNWSKESSSEFGIVLILGGNKKANDKIINVFKGLLSKKDEVLMSVRSHPLSPLTKSHIETLNRDYPDWFDASNRRYGDIPAKYILAISVSSTAMIEAAKSGCGIIWCPYMDEQALIMYSIMEKLGKLAKNDNDLIESVECLLNDADAFRTFSYACERDANLFFGARKTFNEGYNDLTNKLIRYSTGAQLFGCLERAESDSE